ncbi:MAG: thioredoxin fold domain-containing protein [Flavobacteriaceae bacterium]
MKKLDNSSQKHAKTKSHPFWRWFWLTFLVVSLYYAWYSFYVPSNDIEWTNNVTSAQILAKDSGKNTLIFFTGKWCSPCRIMKREIFAEKETMKIINSQVVPVMIDIDDPNTIEFVKQYKVVSTPTTIIIDSEGKVLDYAVGKIGKKKFVEMLNNLESQ